MTRGKRLRIALACAVSILSLAGTSASATTYAWEGIDYGKQNNGLNPGFHHQTRCVNLGDDWIGQGCYYGDDDDFRVFDDAPDGRRIGLEWRTDYGRWGMCVSKEGNSLHGERKCYKDFKEHHHVQIRVMACDGDAFSCGKPVRGSGWFGEDGGPTPTAWSRWST